MLTRFRVTNFKRFGSPIEMDLSSPASYGFGGEAIRDGCVSKGIIYGANDSGKTCLCLALIDITLHLTDNKRLPDEIYHPTTNLHAGGAGSEFLYEFRFGGRTVRYSYTENSFMELVDESLSIDGKEIVAYDFGRNVGFSRLKGTGTLRLESRNSPVSRVKYIKANSILDESDEDVRTFLEFMDFVDGMLFFYSLQGNEYQGLRIGKENITEEIAAKNKTGDFEAFLNECGINCALSEKPVYGNQHKDIFWRFDETCNDVGFWRVASNGTRALTLLYYWFYVQDKKPSLVIIDEFDAFYHFRLARKIVERLKGFNDVQILLTTHDTDLLSNDLLRPDCYFLIRDGKIESLNNLTGKEIRFGNNIQKMYKDGFFDE